MARDSLYGPCVQPIVGASRYLYIRESSILFRSWFAASRRGVGPVNANYRSASRGDPKRKSTSQSLLVEARPNGSLSCRHKRKKAMFLRAGGCGLCSSFDGVDHDSLFAALRGGGVDGIQVDAFRCELLEGLRQCTRFVG